MATHSSILAWKISRTEEPGRLQSMGYWEQSRWHSGKESVCQCKRLWFDPWLGKIPWRRKWQPTPVFLPEKSHGQIDASGGHSPWGYKESDTRLKRLSIQCPKQKPFYVFKTESNLPLEVKCLENFGGINILATMTPQENIEWSHFGIYCP